jgi:formylglycine-generating enzyme required for sulfatase activity
VEYVTWFDAIEYCNRLSVREGLRPAYTISGSGDNRTVTWTRDADGYRLPTEAEWEYACRAGITRPYSSGSSVDSAGWYKDNSGETTHPVGQKKTNALGLYDMHGNVWEWCWDWYGLYADGTQADPTGAASGSSRMARGGSWFDNAQMLRSATRFFCTPSHRLYNLGFRLVRP